MENEPIKDNDSQRENEPKRPMKVFLPFSASLEGGSSNAMEVTVSDGFAEAWEDNRLDDYEPINRDEELAKGELQYTDRVGQEIANMASEISGIRLREIKTPSRSRSSYELHHEAEEEIAKAKELLKQAEDCLRRAAIDKPIG